MDKQLFLNELSLALDSQPTLSLNELLDYVLDLKYPSRKHYSGILYETGKETEYWRPTNEDIYKALRSYNTMRTKFE